MRHIVRVAALIVPLACSRAQTPAQTAAAPAPAQARPARVVYTPGQTRYRATQHMHQEQLIEGNRQAGNYLLEVFSTATLAGAAGAQMSFSVLLDSVRAEGGLITPAEVDRARGVQLRGSVTPEGLVSEFTGDSALSGQLQNIASATRLFYPRLPAGGAQPGQAWSDTSEMKTTGATQLTIRMASDRRAVDWTERDGRRALHIASDATYTITGTGQQMGQDFTISGNGVRQGNWYVSADGTYLGATSRDSSNVTVVLSAMGMSFPSIQIRHDTVTTVP